MNVLQINTNVTTNASTPSDLSDAHVQMVITKWELSVWVRKLCIGLMLFTLLLYIDIALLIINEMTKITRINNIVNIIKIVIYIINRISLISIIINIVMNAIKIIISIINSVIINIITASSSSSPSSSSPSSPSSPHHHHHHRIITIINTIINIVLKTTITTLVINYLRCLESIPSPFRHRRMPLQPIHLRIWTSMYQHTRRLHMQMSNGIHLRQGKETMCWLVSFFLLFTKN